MQSWYSDTRKAFSWRSTFRGSGRPFGCINLNIIFFFFFFPRPPRLTAWNAFEVDECGLRISVMFLILLLEQTLCRWYLTSVRKSPWVSGSRPCSRCLMKQLRKTLARNPPVIHTSQLPPWLSHWSFPSRGLEDQVRVSKKHNQSCL